jgi:hypothetical protein
MVCGALYINGKLLKRRCLKWARIAHLDIWNTSYDQKKGRESASFDSRPLKVGNRPKILGCRRRATYRWKKLLTRATTLLQTALRSEVYSQSYGASKSRESRRARFRDSRVGVPGEKSHLDVGPVESHKVYYKGEGGGFPQVRAVGVLCVRVARGSSQHQRCSNYALTTLCGLCAGPCEWISLSILPSPVPELQHAPLPLKVLWARERIPTPPSSVVFHLDSPLSPSRSWECVKNRNKSNILKFS